MQAIPDAIPIKVGSRFQGLQNEYINIEIPHRKPTGEELSQSKKQDNQIFSRERVRYENALAGVKRYRVIADIYRNRVSNFNDRLMLTAVGLWNFYLIAA